MKKILKSFYISILSLSLLLNPYLFNQNNIYAEIPNDVVEEAYLFAEFGYTPNNYGFPLLKVDINNDGYEDVMINNGTNNYAGSNSGASYIYFGGENPDYIPDIKIYSNVSGQSFGNYGMSTMGDMNGE
ncbi:MAG: FG-GAP repeat protein [candidate division CPR3 bacterium GW2011_GWE2_35_7]|nr:MAG: FG-GAP repeat protein [candidate division CPR3 bacterium GW2011_GWE2_35_7]